MKPGKLSLENLKGILSKIPALDPRVIVGPSLGEDASLINMGDQYLVAKTDPITFPTSKSGSYAVNVNANDIAVMGAKPKWFLITILMPPSSKFGDITSLMEQVIYSCEQLNITIIGGHTEITDSVNYPVISGTMLGEVTKGSEVLSSNAAKGDAILLTKGIPIEGCSILATEARNELIASGVSEENIMKAAELIHNPGISVVKDAEIALSAGNVTAMHDPTEGGLASGLMELAHAANLGMVIDRASIKEIPESQFFCRALRLNPLGLIASGALLICVPQSDEKQVIKALQQENISAFKIGMMTDKDKGIKMIEDNKLINLPHFETDEIARFFSNKE